MKTNLILKNFDLVSQGADGVPKLRQAILRLAVEGKLVSQNPNSNSKDFISIIREKRSRLMRDRKIIEKNELEPITEKEKPYLLPNGWEFLRLGGIALKLGAGSTPLGGKKVYVNHGVKFLRSQNVWNDGLYLTDVAYIDEKVHEDMDGTWVKPKDILLNITGASIGRSCVVPDEFDTANVSQHVAIVRLVEPELRWFLHLYVISPVFQKMIDDAEVGVSREGLSMGKLKKFVIPVPPVEEQKRIVAKVDQLMALCNELEAGQEKQTHIRQQLNDAALNDLLFATTTEEFEKSWQRIVDNFDCLYDDRENFQSLRQTILQMAIRGKLVQQNESDEPVDQMFSRVVEEKRMHNRITSKDLQKNGSCETLGYELPVNWRWRTLEDILIFGPTNGFSPKAVEYETPVRSLTLTATTSGKFKPEHTKFISNNISKDSGLWLRDGDILVQRGNSIEYVGVSAVYRGKPYQFIYPDLMMKLRISKEMNVDFVHLTMNSEPCRNFLRERASGTSGSMPKINQTTLKSLPLPIPPVVEQNRIVDKVNQLMALCDELEKRLVAKSSHVEKITETLMRV